MKTIKIVPLILIGLNSICYSQSQITELKLNYNSDTLKTELTNDKNKKVAAVLRYTLKDVDLNLTADGFPDKFLFKIIEETNNKSYSSDGIPIIIPGGAPKYKISITKGILHYGDRDIKMGSQIKIVIPGSTKSWLINTGLDTLKNDTPKNLPLSSTNSNPNFGIPFYDAKYILDAKTDKDTSLKILLYYLNDTSVILSKDYGIDKRRIENIYKYIKQKEHKNAIKESTGGNLFTSIFSSIPNAIGNYDVTNIADGIARFLVTRVKEELSISFFQHFKDQLDKNPASDLQYLFPVTYDLLHSLDHEIYNWDNYINSLREGFDKDISNLVPNLETFEARASLLKKFRMGTANQISAQLALYMAKGFVNHVQAGQLLDDFNADEFIQPTEEEKDSINVQWATFNLRNSIKTLQLVSSSVRTRAEGEYWINDFEFGELLHNTNLFDCYSMLLSLEARKQEIRFQKNPGKTAAGDYVYLQKLINNATLFKPVVNGFTVKIKDFRASYSKMKTAIDNAKTDSLKAKISYVDVYPFIQSTIGILKYTNTALLKLKIQDSIPGMKKLLLKSDTIIDMLSRAGELGMDVSLRRYAAVIADITYLINRTGKCSGFDLSTDVNANDLSALTENLIKYGSFMASVVKAKDSKEVEKVIQNFALPTGSSRIKRTSAFNVSVNAYPGLFTGYEQIKGVDPGLNKGNFNSFGITAPIGVSTSFGQRKFIGLIGKEAWSYSLFISAIDIGAVAAFRFQNDTVESVPTIKLKDIISPGAFLSIGIPKCPLSFNVGVQVGPNLRKIASSPDKPELINNYSSNIYVRYSFSLCVDIPVLNLVNRTERRNTH